MPAPRAADAHPALTGRALNRALLARQLLVERAALDIPTALERMGGLQAQYAPAMYVGLWSRLRRFTRDELTAALVDRRVVQGTLLRSTIHLVSAADYWPFAVAIRAARRQWWLRTAARGAPEADLVAAAGRLRSALAAGPLPRRQVEEVVGKGLAGVGLWLDLVRVPPSGTWERRRADLFGLAEDWLPPPPDVDSAAFAARSRELLVRRYLGAFGPAPRRDVANWAGMPVTELADAFDAVAVRRFRDERGGELLDLPDAPLPDPGTPAPVRLLPWFDASLLAHARRTGILPERHRGRLFTMRNPQSVATFTVDGAVAGAWRYDAGRVELEPYEELDAATLRTVRAEADAVAALYA